MMLEKSFNLGGAIFDTYQKKLDTGRCSNEKNLILTSHIVSDIHGNN